MGKNKRRRSDLDLSCNDVPSKKIKLKYDQEDRCTTRGCEDTDIKSKRKKKHKHKRQQIKDNVQTIEISADFKSSSDKLSKKKKHKFHRVVLDHHKTHKKKHKIRELHHSHVTSDNHQLCDEKSGEHSRDDAIVSNNEQVPQKKKKKSYDSHVTRMEVTTSKSYNKHPSPKSHDDRVTDMEVADSSFNDSQEVVEDPSSKSCDSKHITKDSLKSSYHWENRQLLLQELKDYTEDEEENLDDDDDEEEEVANEDTYIDLHRYFVTKAQDIAKLEDKHDKWKRGRWSKQEMDILKRNVKEFMKENSIDDLAKWMFSNNSKHVGFYQRIARNIHRPLFPIYRKLVRIFDINNYVGEWDDEKDKELLRLHGCHGNMWTKIGRSLGISGQSCRDRYNLIKSRQRTRGGEWSIEEHDKLCKAIQEYCGDWQGPVGMLPSTVTWDMISEKVGSRSAIQCRQKWVLMLSWKQQGGEEHWSSADDLRLIEELSKDEETEDEEEVDWEGLAIGWESTRSKYYLRRKWWVLKRSVPLSKLKTYQECITYLLKHRVPALKKTLSQ